jgi:hypothetical protein
MELANESLGQAPEPWLGPVRLAGDGGVSAGDVAFVVQPDCVQGRQSLPDHRTGTPARRFITMNKDHHESE